MSKKFYELVARIIHENTIEIENHGDCLIVEDMIYEFASEFADNNPLFDEKRFRKACEN